MSDKNRPCLIGQTNCGRELGNPVCPWCGIDERVVYPSQADLGVALAQAKADYQRRLDEPEPTPAPTPIPTPTPTPPATPRKPGSSVKWVSFAVGVAIVIGLGAFIVPRQQEPSTPTPAFAPAPESVTTPEAQPYLTESQVYALYEKIESDETARKTLISEAERGNRYAQHNLGRMYRLGHGITKNDEQAIAWYQKAAEQGIAWAQFELGNMYAQGQGIAKSDAQAVAWYRKAAEQGNATSQYYLGLMYDKGRGIPKDQTLAIFWMHKAADQGISSAQIYLDLNNSKMMERK